MSNRIPQPFAPLVQLLANNAAGAATHGATINLKQNTEAAIRLDLTALTGTPAGPDNVPPAVPGLKSLWNSAKTAKITSSAGFRTAQSNGRALAMACIGTLKLVLGNQWNSAWNEAGFTGGSLGVSGNPLVMLQQLGAYYEANPTREVADVNGIACTAVACNAAATAVSAAESASNNANTKAGTAQANLRAGLTNGRNRGSGLLTELTQLLDASDPRWLAFGFDMPGHPAGPDVPANVTVTPGGPGSHILFIHWSDARRADGYRATVTDPATGTVLAEQLTQDAEVAIANLTGGATVNITVSARNATGESQPSAPVTAIVP
jgi:hypothetical protein